MVLRGIPVPRENRDRDGEIYRNESGFFVACTKRIFPMSTIPDRLTFHVELIFPFRPPPMHFNRKEKESLF
jgi:hypothetical protein